MAEGTIRITDASIKNKHVADDADLDPNKFAQRANALHTIPLTHWRTWDALATNLPGTPASDDLGITTGTWGTNAPYISAGDLKAAGATTRRAACVVALPPNYEDGETVSISAWAGMTTTIADASCTIDFEIWEIEPEDGTLGSADLVTTAATTMNSTTEAEKSFAMTSTDLVAGSLLYIRMSITCTDAATVTAVIPSVWTVQLKADTRG